MVYFGFSLATWINNYTLSQSDFFFQYLKTYILDDVKSGELWAQLFVVWFYCDKDL